MRKVVPFVVIPLILALIVCLSIRQHRRVEAEKGVYTGTIEAEESRVGSTVGGRVERTPVAEGQTVRKGRLLIVFESDELRASLEAGLAAERQAADRLKDLQAGPRAEELDRARGAVEQAHSQLDKLRRGSRPEEIAAAKAAVEQARQKLALLEAGPRREEIDRAKAVLDAAESDRRLAEQSLHRAEALYKDGALSAQALDEARARTDAASARRDAAKRQLEELQAGFRLEDIRAARQALRQAEAQYELVKKGPRVEDIQAAEAVLKQAQATLAELQAGYRPNQIAQAQSALEQAQATVSQIKAKVRERAVFAPKSGQLQVLNVQVGDIVAPGQSVGVIIDPRDLYIKVYVPEKELGNLRVGAKLPVVTDSGVRVTGMVEQIPVEAEFTPRNVQTKDERALQVYAVKILLPNPDLKLRAGMSADVRLGEPAR